MNIIYRLNALFLSIRYAHFHSDNSQKMRSITGKPPFCHASISRHTDEKIPCQWKKLPFPLDISVFGIV